ncbi:hypothetical protein EVAR_28540_1 [Eumeta japonica]|uniref:Uncharacterized protein n=1 Tax=Eumeta variegata TaxID=151549 RepID=A0A4C1UWN8_EUMVA|nr:hypothetical protein EVAR_28540_1 [Eumeta japonica]
MQVVIIHSIETLTSRTELHVIQSLSETSMSRQDLRRYIIRCDPARAELERHIRNNLDCRPSLGRNDCHPARPQSFRPKYPTYELSTRDGLCTLKSVMRATCVATQSTQQLAQPLRRKFPYKVPSVHYI